MISALPGATGGLRVSSSLAVEPQSDVKVGGPALCVEGALRPLVAQDEMGPRGSALGLGFLTCRMQVSGHALTQMRVVLVLGELTWLPGRRQ